MLTTLSSSNTPRTPKPVKTSNLTSQYGNVIAALARSDPLEYQRAIGAAKTKIVFEGHINLHITRRVGAVVQIALGILVEEVGRWGCLLVMQRQHREDAFDAAGPAEQVTGHRLGRTHHRTFGVIAQRSLDGVGFVQIAQGR